MKNETTSSPLTPEELRELVELEEKATCAPWIHKRQVIYSDHGLAPFVAQTLPDLTRFPSKSDEEYAERNSALIVSLRNAAPRLFSELAALREENARLSEEVIARVAQVENLTTENGRRRACNVATDPAPVESHCSNCGRPWCVDAMGDARCCWEPSKCSRGAHQSAPAQEAREG